MKSIKLASFTVAASLQLLACGPQSDKGSQVYEAWNQVNNPAIITGNDMVTSFKDLPLKGQIEQKGWSDDYWPTSRGGITFRYQTGEMGYSLYKKSDSGAPSLNMLSPAEKYDLFMNRLDFPTVQSELKRTNVLKTVKGHSEFEEGYTIEGWEGLCHGWAPAALNFKEPTKRVTVATRSGNVEFYSSDIKALLTYYQQYNGNRSTRTSMVANRCNVDFAKLDERFNSGEISQEEWKTGRESSACADINAGAFHMIIANELGRKKLGFVVDVTRDFQVWNQPVNGFVSQVKETTVGAGEGAAPGTVKEVNVETSMNYTVEINTPSRYPVGASEATAYYSYILELNSQDQIIGGRWTSEERPDFAWRETVPEFRGYFAGLKFLYEQSISTRP